jgi:glutamate dehydrogenase (NADP+)
MLELALSRLHDAAAHVSIDQDVLEKLKYPRETLKVRLMIRMDDGSRKSFLAWRCRYDDTRGPTKGGIRFHPDATVDEVETLAFWMTFKCAVMNLPYGGGKGAIQVEPRSLSRSELERLSRSYVQAFARMIGPDRDIPAPDVYTNAMIMGWMADEYASIVGEAVPAVITGKPIALGGSLGRDDATARGGYYLVNHLAKDIGLPKKMRVAIQGFGNAGQFMAKLAAADGHVITAVSDSRGAVAAERGLPVDKLLKVKAAGGAVSDLAGSDGVCAIAPDDVIAGDCDLLVPAAMENMIDGSNAGRITAKVILELANGPITPEGDAVLAKRGVTVLPDILANAGGVIGSYFEWTMNIQQFTWDESQFNERLAARLTRAYAATRESAEYLGCTLRSGAYSIGVERVAEAVELRGYI